MDEKLEQRAYLQICVKNEISCADSFKMLQKEYGDACMSRTRAYDWYKRFKGGRENLENDEIPGRPTTSVNEKNIESAMQIVLENPCVSIREIAKLLGISFGSAEHILTKVLGMKRVASRLVPRIENGPQNAYEGIENADAISTAQLLAEKSKMKSEEPVKKKSAKTALTKKTKEKQSKAAAAVIAKKKSKAKH